VDDGDDGGRQRASQGLPAEVQHYQLHVGGVKPEPRRQLRGRLRRPLHCTAELLCCRPAAGWLCTVASTEAEQDSLAGAWRASEREREREEEERERDL